MPIYVTFYHLDQTMVGKTEGEVTLADLLGYLDDVEKAKAVGYAKIFDCSAGQTSLMPVERETLRQRLATYHAKYGKQAGPFAVVAGPDVIQRLGDLNALVRNADTRPVEFFKNIHAAREWLEEQAVNNRRTRSRGRG
jgi:hypothetical protein